MNPPPIPPHSDIFSMGATGIPPPPHRGGSSTPDRMYSQSFTRTPSGRRDPPAIPPHSSDATDWDAREEVRRRELEEVDIILYNDNNKLW